MIVLIAGVAGSGKSTVGRMLAGRLRWDFSDADSFHSEASVAKMRAGIPLTDLDRRPWLEAIAAWMDARIAAGESAVAGCSALRRSYRDFLLAGRPSARMVFLLVSPQTARSRLSARTGHFFPASLLDSQFASLEPPAPGPQVLIVDADRAAGEIVTQIVGALTSPP